MANELTLKVLSELFRVAENRQPSYGKWVYASAFDSPGDGTYRSLFTLLYPLRTGESDVPSEAREYGSMRLSKGSVPWEQMKGYLVTLVKEDRFCFPRLPETRMAVDMHPSTPPRRVSSVHSLYPGGHPCLLFNLNVSPESKMSPLNHGPVYSVHFPIYPRTAEAIYDFAGLRTSKDGELSGEFWVLLPDFRARILKVKLSSSKLSVAYECDKKLASELIGKLYVDCGQKSHRDFRLVETSVELDVSRLPDRLMVALMSPDGEVIDDRNYLAWSTWTDGIEFELSPSDLEQVVLAGESETLEFKRELPKRREDIAISVVAMTNRRGGRILIGVDDEANIVGYEGDKAEETIRSILRENCDPPVEPKIDITTVNTKKVVSIIVLDGSDKPYMVKNRGIYVRSGSTNRIATRYELNLMFQPQHTNRVFG
jgi:Putative DNA-binding domain